MSVFMTPEGKPFFGGTYFPPRDGEGLIQAVLRLMDDTELRQALGRAATERVRSSLTWSITRDGSSMSASGPSIGIAASEAMQAELPDSFRRELRPLDDVQRRAAAELNGQALTPHARRIRE